MQGNTFPTEEVTERDGETGRFQKRATHLALETGFDVLLVDDDDDFRETLKIWLSSDDQWVVHEAGDGEEAIDRLDDTIDVLVLDRRMPKLSGPEVVDRLSETGFEGAIIVLSADKPDTHLNEEDVTNYLTKPLGRDDFIDYLRQSL